MPEIIYEDSNLLVVNKPPSIPVHYCGSHYFNTVIGLLKFEMKKDNLYCVHRLDKNTSGVLIFAKNINEVHKFHDKSNYVPKKIYKARIEGIFLENEIIVDKPIYCLNEEEGIYKVAELG